MKLIVTINTGTSEPFATYVGQPRTIIQIREIVTEGTITKVIVLPND